MILRAKMIEKAASDLIDLLPSGSQPEKEAIK
jgi:hypothetical protein